MDLRKFKSDPTKEQDGTWVTLDETCSLLIARADNTKFKEAMRVALKPHKTAVRSGTISEEAADTIAATVMGQTILLGWKGLKLDGKEVTYSPAEATRILKDKTLRDFRQLVISLSEDVTLFREQEMEEAVKNSESGSAGK